MYDSLDKDKDYVSWQNALNAANVSLFKACDGLFTNYAWYDTDKLKESALLAHSLNRQYDVRCGDCNPSWCML